MTKSAKTVIIGLDGIPYGMIKNFAETGVMPNTAELINQGIFRKMQSSIPEVSSVAWSSIITGENPGQHGIFGFMDLFPNSYKMRFPNYNDLKAPPFWEKRSRRAVIINVPSTYPVREMNGVHVSGFVSIDLQKAVYPSFLISKLEELDYRLDVDSEKAHKSIDLFLSDLDKTLDARIECYRYLWDNQDWATFMLVFTGTDRLMHFLWDAYEDKEHKYHDLFIEHFGKIDRTIGEIGERIDDKDLLIILSDHGFERLEKDVYVNYLLREKGFLQFKNNKPELASIDFRTKAFALDPARIYVNLKGKYPCGTVEHQERNGVLRQLEELFGSLVVDGRKVIRQMHRKEDIYSGPRSESGPDLILIASEGFNLRSKLSAQDLAEKSIFTGKHTQHDAFLLLKDSSDALAIPDDPSVFDVVEIMNRSEER